MKAIAAASSLQNLTPTASIEDADDIADEAADDAFERSPARSASGEKSSFDEMVIKLHMQLETQRTQVKALREHRDAYAATAFPPELQADKKAKLASLDLEISTRTKSIAETGQALETNLACSALFKQLGRVAASPAMKDVMKAAEEKDAPALRRLKAKHWITDALAGAAIVASLGGASTGGIGWMVTGSGTMAIVGGASALFAIVTGAASMKLQANDWQSGGDGIKVLDQPALYVAREGFRTLQSVVVARKTGRRSGAPFIPGRKYTYENREDLPRPADLEAVTTLLQAHGVTAEKLAVALRNASTRTYRAQ